MEILVSTDIFFLILVFNATFFLYINSLQIWLLLLTVFYQLQYVYLRGFVMDFNKYLNSQNLYI